ncbi:SAM-dependent methyltransferase [Amycolatopsis oliviviridis]|uniref:Methyltransferase n=1 Tax=Amycolatopsis oliviviridis TaxID=1471590 RepID=A0ABQ3LPS7_9PSEU|nr:SAM-dependent methyltransferase [Amycolatopsis oliviviridis]GHH21270.1 hypothetical protein GCM10017790_42100 [Amycolatopsis oliviviridis]
MTTQQDPRDPDAPEGVDLERPNVARVYDWFLGGSANWAIDREFGSQVLKQFPEVKTFARVGRDFLGRGVGYLARQGITQFLDIGSGVPTVGNVHQIASAINPDSRVVYVDIEPVAVAHSQLLLEREGLLGRHAVLQGDVRDPADIWKRALETGVLDPRQPIGLCLVGLLYFLGPDEPVHEMVQRYLDLLPSGSYFLSSHLTEDGVTRKEGDNRENVQELYKKTSAPFHLRSRAEFTAFFDGLELVEPGIDWMATWHLDEAASRASDRFADDPTFTGGLGGLGRKP